MSDLTPDVSWFQKYRPKNVEDLVFENDGNKVLVEKWLNNEVIDGNVLLYGPHGKGKTTLSRILIAKIIKNQADLYIVRSRSVKEIDEVAQWIKKKPVKSHKKIIYIEEFDKISGTALDQLKDTLMEDFQSHAIFICTTNHYNRLPKAILDRFNYQLPFEGKNIEGVKKRLEIILNNEGAKYDPQEFSKFVDNYSGRSFRRIISYLQESFISNNGIINFSKLEEKLNLEQTISQLFVNMIFNVMKIPNPKDRRQCLVTPMDSSIASDYNPFVSILHNNYDLDYGNIYENIYDKINFIPIKLKIGEYNETADFKKWPHIHLIGCWYECIKCATEVLM